MNILDDIFIKNPLIDLATPTGWQFVKNNLLNLDMNYINRLRDYEDFFMVEDLYLQHDVFYTVFENSTIPDLFKALIYVTAYPKKSEDGTYLKIEYEVDFLIVKKNKKKDTVLKYTSYCENLLLAKSKLNNLFLFTYLKLNDLIEKKMLDRFEDKLIDFEKSKVSSEY